MRSGGAGNRPAGEGVRSTVAMQCSHCGIQSPGGSPFCEGCGHALPKPAPAPAVAHGGTARLATAGFVVAFFVGPVGLVLSILGYQDVKESNGRLSGEGLARAGMIVSVVNMIVALMVMLSR